MSESVKICSIMLAIAIVAGCTSHQPVNADASEYKRIDSEAVLMERYREYRRLCMRSGGRVSIERRGMVPAHCARQFCPPGPNDQLSCIIRSDY